MDQKRIIILPGEAWYGCRCDDGFLMPITAESVYTCCLEPSASVNQVNPLLLSSRGRWLWCDTGFTVDVRDGVMLVTARAGTLELKEGSGTLRGAYLAARDAHFPPTGKLPPENFFVKPQYNTWIELGLHQTQERILEYAHRILDEGYPAGILMIDDGWNKNYGTLEFVTETFPDPKGMMDELHALGFEVMLWICPFISADTPVGRMLAKRGLLVRDPDGEVAIKHWWDGYSAVLDLSNPEALDWFRAQLDGLMADYGVDGFKFDAGDARFYAESDVTLGNLMPNGETAAWAKLGSEYAYNEFRACYTCAGYPLVQRLHDKCHTWDTDGMASLVPNQLLQGILGFAYTCPDMIGGGMLGSFREEGFRLDEELFVRYAQCAALSPMMQFSAAPWRVLSPENNRRCLDTARLHTRWADLILRLARESAATGEPIYRYMEYVFPGEGLAAVTDQFMLGDGLLVAPVLEKGARTRTVRLPDGRWRYLDGTVYDGGGAVTVPADLDTLPYFEKL